MKVWILIQDYGWDGQTVKFVASTREAAEKLRDTYLAEYAERPDEGPRWEIEEFEIDREQEIS